MALATKSQEGGWNVLKNEVEWLNMQKVRISFAKRLFDITVSLALIVLLSPFIILIMLLMLAENIFVSSSRGGIFYAETRISQGRQFKIYKFRIYKNNILNRLREKGELIHTKQLEQNNNNLTYVGRMLKKVYMDELPQLFNVLKGDMSLVGPRPTNPENYQDLIAKGCYSKQLIRAGLTGYFQSHKGLKIDKGQEELDMEYINFAKDNPGWKVVLYDIKIIFITILTILRAEGI